MKRSTLFEVVIALALLMPVAALGGGYNKLGHGNPASEFASSSSASSANSLALSLSTVTTNPAAKLPSTPFRAPTAIYCADAVNGSDSNTGVASGTYPNFTNCVKTASKLAKIITAGSWSYMTGVFRDATYDHNGADMMDLPSTAVNGTSSSPTLITSYGPRLFDDAYSGATGGAIIDGADCAGKVGTGAGNCANAPNPAAAWTLVSGHIYSTPYTAMVSTVYLDNIQTWSDGSTPNTPLSGGLTAASCLTGTCPDGVGASSTLKFWHPSTSYGPNSDVQNPGNPIPISGWWHTALGGSSATSGAGPQCGQTAGNCTAGTTTVTDKGVTWTWEGPGAGKIGAMQTGSWFWDGQKLYVWTPTGDSPANHVVEVQNHVWGIRSDANAPNNNFFDVLHLELRHYAEDGMLWRNNSTSTCPNGNVWAYDFITQTGPSNVDLGQFGNGFRFVDYYTLNSSSHSCSSSNESFIHNAMSYTGDHGGDLTLQIGPFNMVEAYNNLSHGDHAIINNVGDGVAISCQGCEIIGNAVHDETLNFNNNVAANANNGIAQGFGGPITVVGNIVWNIYDPRCVGGSCDCFDFQLMNKGAATVENNTCDSSQEGLYTNGNTTGNGTIFKGNICSNLNSATSTATCVVAHNTTELAASDYNVVSGLSRPMAFNNVQLSLSAWTAATGYDAHSVNSNPTYSTSGYPYRLSSSSAGIGLTLGLGFYGENAGARPIRP